MIPFILISKTGKTNRGVLSQQSAYPWVKVAWERLNNWEETQRRLLGHV